MASKMLEKLMNENAETKAELTVKENKKKAENRSLRIKLEYEKLVNIFGNKSMLGAQELKKALGFEKEFVYGLLKSEAFPVTVINSRRYVSLSNLAEWLAG